MLSSRLKAILITCVFILHTLRVMATTWSAALPYVQRTEGQHVEIRAKAYDPYMPHPYGETEVYYKGRLLYAIDKYYRDRVFASDDGTYLAVVATNNYAGIGSITYFGQNWIDYSNPAITIYKNGVLFKTYLLRDVADTATLVNNGVLYDWGYSVEWSRENVHNWQWECEYCNETYTRAVLESCDTSEIDTEECTNCRLNCDSLEAYETEKCIAEHNVYVQDNKLHIITNQGKIWQLNFHNLALNSMPVETLLKDKKKFSPPVTTTEYDTSIILPEHLDKPTIDGAAVEQKLIAYLHRDETIKLSYDNNLSVYVRKLVVNNRGLCEELDIDIYGNMNKNKKITTPSPHINFRLLYEKITHWLMIQHYDRSSVPKGFKKYSYTTYLNLYKR